VIFMRIPLIAMLGLTWTIATMPGQAAEPSVVKLWPDGAPLAKGSAESDQPTLTIWPAPADKANGSAVVLCPGGGYWNLATGHEGKDVAEWFNQLGVSVFMLKYRLAQYGYQHPAPLLDVQRAIRYVRAGANQWKVDPRRIGVMGFSAGGHLASTAATHYDAGKADSTESIDRASCRPDFAILCYPVVMLGSDYTHKGSQQNLLGANPDPQLIENLSNEKQVTKETPPTFLFHTGEDAAVAPENSVMFYLALRKHGVPAELHIYEKGAHGIGLGANVEGAKTWPDRLRDWLGVRGLLKKS
jgi:acetyl esterase/lipase